MRKLRKSGKREYRSPLSDSGSSHPGETGRGAAVASGATGAAMATVRGRAGASIGASIGAMVGGLAGKGIADSIDPVAEDAYWRSNFVRRHYATGEVTYDRWASAYRFGWEARGRHADRRWDDVEAELRKAWNGSEDGQVMEWDQARAAVRDAWDRIGRSRADLFLVD